MNHLPSTVHPIVDKQSSICHLTAKHSTTYFGKWFFIKKTSFRAVQCKRSHTNVLHPVTGSEVSVKTVTKRFGGRRKHTLFYGTSAHRRAHSPLVCPEPDHNPFNPHAEELSLLAALPQAGWSSQHRSKALSATCCHKAARGFHNKMNVCLPKASLPSVPATWRNETTLRSSSETKTINAWFEGRER